MKAGSAPLLLAMKLRASRPGRDGDDFRERLSGLHRLVTP